MEIYRLRNYPSSNQDLSKHAHYKTKEGLAIARKFGVDFFQGSSWRFCCEFR